jgi:hypothetical protein
MVTVRLSRKLGARIGTHPPAKGVVLALKFTGLALFFRKLSGGHIGLNRRTAAIAALAAIAGCGHAAAASERAAAATSVLGVPLYAGAQPDAGGSLRVRNGRQIRENAAFQTGDAFERVVGFYRRRLPPGSMAFDVTTGNGQAASFGYGAPANRTTVEIASSKPGETDILITRVRSPLAVGS